MRATLVCTWDVGCPAGLLAAGCGLAADWLTG